jgi:hypothetical protein
LIRQLSAVASRPVERCKSVLRPKLGGLIAVLDAILAADETAPVKQRHTAKRIWQRLRESTVSGAVTPR